MAFWTNSVASAMYSGVARDRSSSKDFTLLNLLQTGVNLQRPKVATIPKRSAGPWARKKNMADFVNEMAN